MLRRPVYMDNHATTACDPAVIAAMTPYFGEIYGNAASRNHVFGWKAEEAVERARAQVANAIGASPREIVFTSGATESDNLMLKGAARFYREKGNHIVTLATEHKAVLDSCLALEAEGFEVTVVTPRPDGLVDAAMIESALTERTILVSVMWANNEIGTLQPIEAIGRLCRGRGILFAVDAAQAVGKVPVDVERAQVDLLALSGHKIYGPKGVGALYVRRKPRVRLTPLIDGGGHEKGMRSGTLNVPGIVGMGEACALAVAGLEEEAARLLRLRERLYDGIVSGLTGVTVNGTMAEGRRLPGNLNLSFDGVEGESLLLALRDIAVSSGSACSSASIEPSHVITALGGGNDRAHASIRFGLGRFNTEEEVDFVAGQVVATVRKLRALASAPGAPEPAPERPAAVRMRDR